MTLPILQSHASFEKKHGATEMANYHEPIIVLDCRNVVVSQRQAQHTAVLNVKIGQKTFGSERG